MKEFLILQTAAIAAGFIIDFFVGDPHFIPHPVAGIGKLISFFDRHLRRGNSNPDDFSRGVITVILTAFISTAVPALILWGAWAIHPLVFFGISCIMCWQVIAARQLARESRAVQKHLENGDTEGARKAVSMIVGRDTESLDDKGITRAAVETVAENTSDGVIAPLIWMIIFGAPGGFFYKSINTMDSMLGYKNDKYLYFGRAAAKTDDFCNWFPARFSALLMIAVCPICALDTKNAWKIFKRDRFKHASPNSAQTESVCAGALDVQLAGDAYYGGVLHKKEFIGDPIREIEPYDITRACRLMYMASLLMLLIGILVRFAVVICL